MDCLSIIVTRASLLRGGTCYILPSIAAVCIAGRQYLLPGEPRQSAPTTDIYIGPLAVQHRTKPPAESR